VTAALALQLVAIGGVGGVVVGAVGAAHWLAARGRIATVGRIDLGVVEGRHHETDATSADVAAGQRETAFTAGDVR